MVKIMNKGKKIAQVVKKYSFAEAEEADIEYYANVDWKESAANVEEMRKGIWNAEYKKGMEKIIRKSTLKEERDDIE
jgi:16S rRNA U516 pseudouridylate synthase RsuA-like enzyme